MEEKNKEITITYETLFELLRREKEREELQKLTDSFFNDAVDYLREKKQILSQEQTELFSAEEKTKTENQLKNIKKILRELYERRERKIINMAIDKSRTKSTIIDTSALLKEEKQLFELLIKLLDKSRESIVMNILNEKLPVSIEEKKEPEEPKPVEKKEKSTKLVRFLHAVPRFVGPALEEYGPFEEEDVASLPVEIAHVLINKGRVEGLEEK